MDVITTADRDGRAQSSRRVIFAVAALSLLLGIAISQFMGPATRGSALAQGAATPSELTESEREELNRLRAIFAEGTPCVSPEATPNAVAEASPVPIEPLAPGTPVETADEWAVTALSLNVSAPENLANPQGRFLQVEMTVVNNANFARPFDFASWVLIDDQGRIAMLDHLATVSVSGPQYYLAIGPGEAATFNIVYDVARDTGTTFTFVNRSDPTLIYSLSLQTFG